MSEVIVFGASGYSGLELLRLLAWHPAVRVAGASSDRWAGAPLARHVRGWTGPLAFASHDELSAAARGGQVALLATPAKTSAELAPALLARGLRVVDLSGAFRLRDPEAYPAWYGFAHPAPALLSEAVYGMPELAPVPRDTRLVANPGCYATAAILAVLPFLRAGLLEPGAPVIVDGKSGTTGAGRALEESLQHAEVAENLRAYRVGKHQHTPEIEAALARGAGRPVRVAFTAHLVPMRRGILASAYLTARPEVTQAQVDEALAAAWRDAAFVRAEGRPPETARVQGTNFVEVSAVLDARTSTLIALSALDNLVKGAAGQAIQNLNALLGLPTELGLVPALEVRA